MKAIFWMLFLPSVKLLQKRKIVKDSSFISKTLKSFDTDTESKASNYNLIPSLHNLAVIYISTLSLKNFYAHTNKHNTEKQQFKKESLKHIHFKKQKLETSMLCLMTTTTFQL